MKSSIILLDTNILLDIFTDNKEWCEWSITQIERHRSFYQLIINPIIYTELSIGFDKIEILEKSLYLAKIKLQDIPREALFLAGKAFLTYRKSNKGIKNTTLPDFFIGAHAAVAKYKILTRDPKRIKHYFPSVNIIHP